MGRNKGRNPDSGQRNEGGRRSWGEKKENASQTRRELPRSSEYRVRPRVAEDCRHYVRTGQCKYGERCKYNHPQRNQVKDKMVQTCPAPVPAQLPERNQTRHDMVQTYPAPVRAQLPERNQLRHDMVQTCPAPVPAQVPERNQMRHDMVQTYPTPVRAQLPERNQMRHGSGCHFNHPPSRVAKVRPKRTIRRICKYFTGGNCMHGSSCAYYHPMDTAVTTSHNSFDEGRHGTESSSMAEKRARTVQDSVEPDPSERPQDNPENRNVSAQENLQEQADMERQMREAQKKAQEERRQIDIQRREARLRLEQMRPTTQLDNLVQIRKSLPDIGIERKEGDGF